MSNPARRGPSVRTLRSPGASRARGLRSLGIAAIATALVAPLFVPSSAFAAPRDYAIRWIPSTSTGVTTYLLSVGTSSGQYDVELDLGVPAVVQNEMQTTVTLDDAADLYLAMRARNDAGLSSTYSNEVIIAAGVVVPSPSPGPGPGPGGGATFGVTAIEGMPPVVAGSVPVIADVDAGTGSVVFYIDGDWVKTESRAPYSLAGDGGWSAIRAWDSTTLADGLHLLTAIGYAESGGQGAAGRSVSIGFTVDNVPDTVLPVRIGLTTGSTSGGPASRIDWVDEYGMVRPLLVDDRAIAGDLRPAWCDLDGDGDQDLLLGFGPGGGGRLLVVELAGGSVASTSEIDLSGVKVWVSPGVTETYAAHDGQTTPACGDLDGDGRNEIAVALGPGPGDKLHLYDDLTTGYAEYPQTGGLDPTDVRFAGTTDVSRGAWPAIGDFDGDGVDEILVTRTGPGPAGLAIFDDARDGFEAVYSEVGVDGSATPFPLPAEIAFAHDGSLQPATGDLDGDGLDEIVLGLGRAGGRRLYVLDDAVAGFAVIVASPLTADGSVMIGPTAKAALSPDARPAVGDLDGDGLDEIIVALGAPLNDGYVYLLDDLHHGFAPFATAGGFVGVLSPGGGRPVAPAISD